MPNKWKRVGGTDAAPSLINVGGMTLDELRDNKALVAGVLVALAARYGTKLDWPGSLGLGALAWFITNKAANERAAKALHSLPHGPEMNPSAEQKSKIKVVPLKPGAAK